MAKIEGKYFADPMEVVPHGGVHMDLVAMIALRLIEHFSVVAAKTDGEDTAGRAKLELQTVAELVDRAFDIALAFVRRAESEGRIVESESAEKRAVKAGMLEKLKTEHSYLGSDNPPESLQELREQRLAKAAERAKREAAQSR